MEDGAWGGIAHGVAGFAEMYLFACTSLARKSLACTNQLFLCRKLTLCTLAQHRLLFQLRDGGRVSIGPYLPRTLVDFAVFAG